MEKCRRHPNFQIIPMYLILWPYGLDISTFEWFICLKMFSQVSQDANFSKPQQEFDDQLGNDDGLPYTVVFN